MTDYGIDPFSDYSLYDVLDESVPAGCTTEYRGFHIYPAPGSDHYYVQLDGHLGVVDQFVPSEEFDDVLELVARLNEHAVRRWELSELSDDDLALVEWAGKMETSDEERANAEPEKWMHIPDDVREEIEVEESQVVGDD